MQKKRPPTEKNGMAPTWREKTATIGETPPPQMENFFIHAPPGERLYPPLVCDDHDLHSRYSGCLRELEK